MPRQGIALDPDQVLLMKSLYEEGKTPTMISCKLKCSLQTVYRYMKEEDISLNKRRKQIGKVQDAKPIQEVDLSSLPDTVLFYHSRSYIF